MSDIYRLDSKSDGEIYAIHRLLLQEIAKRRQGHGGGVDESDTYELKGKPDSEIDNIHDLVLQEIEKRRKLGKTAACPPDQIPPVTGGLIADLAELLLKEVDQKVRDRLAQSIACLAKPGGSGPSVKCPSPGAYPAPVPRTGQTQCWDSHYQLAGWNACDAAPGQDGAIQSGVPWRDPRFEDPGDGTVTDLNTGLIWMKNADTFGEVTWDQARILAAKLESGCHCLSDKSTRGQWRLPTIRELFSMMDYGQAAPIVPRDYPDRNTVKPAIYWSSTTLIADESQAWMMTLGIGPTVFILKNTTNRMWPVRDGKRVSIPKTGQMQTFGFEQVGQDGLAENRKGVEWPKDRFAVDANGRGTVTDNLTGLVWLQNANAFGWQTWEQALKKCHAMHSGSVEGLNDGSIQGQWRLPNVREIESLVDYGRAGPCLPHGWQNAFSNVQPSSYWTSTTVAGAPSQAMFIIFGIGPVIFENKEHPFFVWPVRNQDLNLWPG